VRGGHAARLAVAVLALAGGAVVGGCAVLLHGYWWGLLLGVVTAVALLAAVPSGWWRRLPFALGWCAVTLVLAVERPEGDYLVESSTSGYLLLGAGVGVLLGGIVGVRRHPPPVPSREIANDGSGGPTS
jgi:hypothetical protein